MPGTPTGLVTARCYAVQQRNCDGKKATAEHYFSKVILDGFDQIVVDGFSWQATPDKPIGVGALTAKILCERHNSALSPFDTAAGKLFLHLRELDAALHRGESLPPLLLSGHDIERWCLKLLCGLLAAGSTSKDGAPLPKMEIPAKWLDMLFGEDWATSELKLYLAQREGKRIYAAQRLGAALLSGQDGTPSGIVVEVAGFLFMLSQPETTNAPPAIPRPSVLSFKRATARSDIIISWDDDAGPEVSLERAGSYNGSPPPRVGID